MRTNIILNDDLIAEAFKLSNSIKTKKELVETALKEFVSNRKIRNLLDLKGKKLIDDDYNYKEMR